MSFAMEFDLSGIAEVQARIAQLHRLDQEDLLVQLSAAVESQTRRRIQSEKTSPDGTPWDDWSTTYADTRHGGNSLLQGEGDLLDSITSEVSGLTAEVGSNKVYAAIHQFGGEEVGINIPERPYLGISDENAHELEAIALDYLQELLP